MKQFVMAVILLLGIGVNGYIIPFAHAVDRQITVGSSLGGWVELYSGTSENLNDVWQAPNGDVFAVGDSGTIVYYNGSSCVTMSSGTTKNLTAVWGTSTGNVFAVGSEGTILHYDGGYWSSMDSGVDSSLRDIWGSSASNVYVVGYEVLLRYNGASWTSLKYAFSSQKSIWGTSPNDMFVAGSWSGLAGSYGEIEHFDGANFTDFLGPSSSRGYGDIWATSNEDVFVVVGNPGKQNGAIHHYDGSEWDSYSVQNYSWPFDFKSVWGTSSSDVFAAGSRSNGTLKKIVHYDGSQWMELTYQPSSCIHGIGGNSDIFMVGADGYFLMLDREKASVDIATWYQDFDNDGYGDPNNTLDETSQPAGYVEDNTDCDDTDPNSFPGAIEIAGDGIDQDCNGVDLVNKTTWYQDFDDDGYGNPNITLDAVSQPAGYVEDDTDCDDTDDTVYIGAIEIAGDGIDQDCDGADLVNKTTWYRDLDDDGYGNPNKTLDAVSQPSGYVDDDADCDDTDDTVYPGATEIAGDGIDQDCDGADLANPVIEVPESPTVTVTTQDLTVSLSWNNVSNADGYTLFYAPYPDASTIYSADMGTETSMSVTLWDGVALYVAVQAYNIAGNSGFSNIEYFILGTIDAPDPGDSDDPDPNDPDPNDPDPNDPDPDEPDLIYPDPNDYPGVVLPVTAINQNDYTWKYNDLTYAAGCFPSVMAMTINYLSEQFNFGSIDFNTTLENLREIYVDEEDYANTPITWSQEFQSKINPIETNVELDKPILTSPLKGTYTLEINDQKTVQINWEHLDEPQTSDDYFKMIKTHIKDKGTPIMAGSYLFEIENGEYIGVGGHMILIIGYKTDENGNIIGLYVNDTWHDYTWDYNTWQNNTCYYNVSKKAYLIFKYEYKGVWYTSPTEYGVLKISGACDSKIQILDFGLFDDGTYSLIVPDSITITDTITDKF